MPLLVSDFEFEQSSTHVYITVPWPIQTSLKLTDVYANELYIKINHPPYFFELDLLNKINDDESSVQLNEKSIVFNLKKKDSEMHWDSANYSSTSKEELKERRNEAAQSNFIKKEEEKKRKSKEKWEKQQYLVKQQMQVEQIERKKVENAKETERSLAEASLHEWTNSLATAASPDIRNNKLPSEESSDEEDEEIRRLKEKYQAILNRRKNVNSTSSDRPPPRASGSAIMTFTSRMFPTAARESQDAKWMAQLEEAKKASHEDIQKLESKSNQFMKAEQWYLAIETLTEAIKLAPSNHRCYVARSECYFRVGQYNSALDDIQQSIFHIEAMERQHELVNVYDNVKQALSKRKEICEQRLVAGN